MQFQSFLHIERNLSIIRLTLKLKIKDFSIFCLSIYFCQHGKEIQGVMHYLSRTERQEDDKLRQLRPCAISVLIND
jgi:hypothetical protein